MRFLRGTHRKDVASAEGVPNLGGLGATPPYRKFSEMPFPTIYKYAQWSIYGLKHRTKKNYFAFLFKGKMN